MASGGYLFVPQKKFEAALKAKTKSLADLAGSLVAALPEPGLPQFPLDDPHITKQKSKTLLPLYTLKAAAGCFGNGGAVEPEGWVDAHAIGKLDKRMFVCRAVGRSMEPTIHDGDFLVFRSDVTGTRDGRTVLAQYRGPADPDTGGAFTVKRYSSEKESDDEGGWRHTRVTLSPTNRDYQPIVLIAKAAESVQIVAEFVAVLRTG